MPEPQQPEQQSPLDRLTTRPSEPLPTPLDPAGPAARGHPADPKLGKGNENSPGNPANSDPTGNDVGRVT